MVQSDIRHSAVRFGRGENHQPANAKPGIRGCAVKLVRFIEICWTRGWHAKGWMDHLKWYSSTSTSHFF